MGGYKTGLSFADLVARKYTLVFLFANSKCKRYFNNKLKPSKLTWTAMYLKQHKKDLSQEAIKKRRGATKKPYSRAIQVQIFDSNRGKNLSLICVLMKSELILVYSTCRSDIFLFSTGYTHKVSFTEEALCDNVDAFVNALLLAKPAGLKKNEQSKILPSDKDFVRQNILLFEAQVPPLLRSQLGECLKTAIHADYPEQRSGLLH